MASEDKNIYNSPEVKAIKDLANSDLSTPSTSGSGGESYRSELEKKIQLEIRDAKKKQWEIGRINPPGGTWNSDSVEVEAARKAKREAAAEQRTRLKEAYEQKTMLALEDIANLQRTILRMGTDPSHIIDQEYMERLKLALKGADQVLNRALGRPTSHIESNVTHNIADEIAKMHDEWIVDAEEVDE